MGTSPSTVGADTHAGSADERTVDEEPNERLNVFFLPDYTEVNPYQRELAEALERQGVSVTTSSKGGKWFPVLQAFYTHRDADVFHCHFFHQMMIGTTISDRLTPIISFALSARLLAELLVVKLLGTKLVWTAHDLLNHERRAMHVELAFKHVIIRFLCDDVIIHCDGAAETLIETYRLPERTHEKMTTVPHGHFIDDYPNEVPREDARENLGFSPNETVFLFFGWIRRYKNVPLLVETFRSLDDEDARLLIVGNPRTDNLRRNVLVQSELDQRVRAVFEFVPDERIQYYMNAADIVVLPFRTGKRSLLTSGSAVLAMSFGKPLIAPRLGCLSDLLDREGGFPYETSDQRALRKAMDAALSADLKQMGQHNYNKARRLDWDVIAVRTLDTYRGVESSSPTKTKL